MTEEKLIEAVTEALRGWHLDPTDPGLLDRTARIAVEACLKAQGRQSTASSWPTPEAG